MEMSQNQLIETGLNVIGFLAAGGLLMVLTSVFRKPKSAAKSDVVAITPENPRNKVAVKNRGIEPDFQYISLNGSAITEEEPTTPGEFESNQSRNRDEVYQLARHMLKANRTTDEIFSELPVSDAEINLLKARTNEENGENNG